MENYFSMLQDRTSQDPIRALVIIGILLMFVGLAIAIPRFSRNDEAGMKVCGIGLLTVCSGVIIFLIGACPGYTLIAIIFALSLNGVNLYSEYKRREGYYF